MEETGELARLVNHLHGLKKKKSDEAKQNLEEDIGDIIYTFIYYTDSNGIDSDRAIKKSFEKVIKKDKSRC